MYYVVLFISMTSFPDQQPLFAPPHVGGQSSATLWGVKREKPLAAPDLSAAMQFEIARLAVQREANQIEQVRIQEAQLQAQLQAQLAAQQLAAEQLAREEERRRQVQVIPAPAYYQPAYQPVHMPTYAPFHGAPVFQSGYGGGYSGGYSGSFSGGGAYCVGGS